jgi:hypothetical protein
MAEGRRPVALEDAVGQPGAGIAGQRRRDQESPIGKERRANEEGKARQRAEEMDEPGPRIAVRAQVMLLLSAFGTRSETCYST